MELTRRAAISGVSTLALVQPSLAGAQPFQAVTAAEWGRLAEGLRRIPAPWSQRGPIIYMVAHMPHEPAPPEVTRSLVEAISSRDKSGAFMMAGAAVAFASRSAKWDECARICYETAMRCVEIAEATVA